MAQPEALMQAFENLDARAVARLVLAVVRTKTDSLGFLGQVTEAVSNGPDSSEALPEELRRKSDPPRTEKRKEPPSGGPDPKRHNSRCGRVSEIDTAHL
jgi:hypothetical protein